MLNYPRIAFNGGKIIYEVCNLPNEFPIRLIKDYIVTDDPNAIGVHCHNCLEIGYCCEGSGVFIVEDKVCPFNQGDIVVLFENQIHTAKSTNGETSRWHFLYLDPISLLTLSNIGDFSCLLRALNYNSEFNSIIKTGENKQMYSLFSNIFEELTNEEENFILSVKNLVCSLLIKLNRVMNPKTDVEENLNSTRDYPKIAETLQFISANIAQEIRIESLASLCNMSVTNFRRIFKKNMGLAPLDYIIKLRMSLAAMMFYNSDLSILEISIKVGYNSISNFNRHFKSIMGVTPGNLKLSRKMIA